MPLVCESLLLSEGLCKVKFTFLWFFVGIDSLCIFMSLVNQIEVRKWTLTFAACVVQKQRAINRISLARCLPLLEAASAPTAGISLIKLLLTVTIGASPFLKLVFSALRRVTKLESAPFATGICAFLVLLDAHSSSSFKKKYTILSVFLVMEMILSVSTLMHPVILGVTGV